MCVCVCVCARTPPCTHVHLFEDVHSCWRSLPTSDKVRVEKVLSAISGEKENPIAKVGIQLLLPSRVEQLNEL